MYVCKKLHVVTLTENFIVCGHQNRECRVWFQNPASELIINYSFFVLQERLIQLFQNFKFTKIL